MSKGIQQLLLIFGLVVITTTAIIRPELNSAEEETSSSEEARDRGIEFYLNNVIRKQQLDDGGRMTADKRAVEAAPSVAVRNGSPAAVLYRRSALNKNFIRFGRSGFQPSHYDRPESSEEEEDEPITVRPSRSLKSNFIRFGRSFFPSSRWTAETKRRFRATGVKLA